MLTFETARQAIERAYGGISELAESLTSHELLTASRCHGWVVADVLFHLLNDAQRALIALATPVDGPSDRDFVTYWNDHLDQTETDSIAAIWSTKRAAASLDGHSLLLRWSETAPAAVRAARGAKPNGRIETQGHILAVPDFLATLATEAVIHHLDMTVNLPATRRPDANAMAIAIQTLDELLEERAPGVARPTDWSGDDYILKATGRNPENGPLSPFFPLLR